jgi:hypothetical protein
MAIDQSLELYLTDIFINASLGGHAGNLGSLDSRVYTEVLPFFDTYLKWK